MLDGLMETVQQKMGDLITKPKMSAKVLSKPPFRFLHDTISAVTRTTGFGEGLYDGPELDSAAITDRQAKIDYLNKIFSLVGICKGNVLDVQASRVVAGQEPENTNMFLIALAECAADPMYDSSEAVRRCLSGEAPGSQPPPVKGGGGGGGTAPMAEAKIASPPQQQSKAAPRERDNGDDPDAKTAVLQHGEAQEKLAMGPPPELGAPAMAAERGRSRGSSRGAKQNAPSSGGNGLDPFGGAPSGSGAVGAAARPNLDSEIAKCDGSEDATQALLGAIITKPKLSSKLLGKPPFRFLHDIIMEVQKQTGFGKGLYTETESDSSQVSDKAAKMQFLDKSILLVGIQLNTLVEAKSAKIVAGADAHSTNNFLQLLAVAAQAYGSNCRDAIIAACEQLSAPMGDLPPPSAAPAPAPSMHQQQQDTPMHQSDEKKSDERRSRSREPEAAQAQQVGGGSVTQVQQWQQPEPTHQDDIQQQQQQAGGGAGDEEDPDKRSARPTTARRRPPKVKDGAKEVQAKDVSSGAHKKAEGIIIDGADDDDEIEDEIIADEGRLADDMRAESKSGDAGGITRNDPQSKLVKDIMSRQAEQEAQGRAPVSNTKIVDESKHMQEEQTVAGGSGIRLTRLKKTSSEKTKGGAGGGGSGLGDNELERMRHSIQVLVQHTGPLGSCMDYIQEDISMMTSELHRWEEECRKCEVEYEEAKKKTKEILHPLKTELSDLEDQIIEKIAKISSAKASNARNVESIQQILKLAATA